MLATESTLYERGGKGRTTLLVGFRENFAGVGTAEYTYI